MYGIDFPLLRSHLARLISAALPVWLFGAASVMSCTFRPNAALPLRRRIEHEGPLCKLIQAGSYVPASCAHNGVDAAVRHAVGVHPVGIWPLVRLVVQHVPHAPQQRSELDHDLGHRTCR